MSSWKLNVCPTHDLIILDWILVQQGCPHLNILSETSALDFFLCHLIRCVALNHMTVHLCTASIKYFFFWTTWKAKDWKRRRCYLSLTMFRNRFIPVTKVLFMMETASSTDTQLKPKKGSKRCSYSTFSHKTLRVEQKTGKFNCASFWRPFIFKQTSKKHRRNIQIMVWISCFKWFATEKSAAQ